MKINLIKVYLAFKNVQFKIDLGLYFNGYFKMKKVKINIISGEMGKFKLRTIWLFYASIIYFYR